jgi:cell volume regulation protein A
MQYEIWMLIGALLILISIIATRTSRRFGVPALLLFLTVGMLAGSDGPGGIAFADYRLAQTVGIVALAYILFSGGLDTDWRAIKPVMKQGLVLANVGVVLSMLILGGFAMWALGFDWKTGLLLGAIISSTDAAAVFSVMRERGVNLKNNLEPLIELESGSNDPIAVFLTTGLISLIMIPESSIWQLIPSFVLQMSIGALGGWVFGQGLRMLVNRIQLQQEGLYVVLTLAATILIYAATTILGGNGFLAVYIAGIVVGNHDIVHKRSILQFHDGIAWLMQIGMFLTLGLLVFPSQLWTVAPLGLAVALFMVFVARPISVLISLLPFKRSLTEIAMVSASGLRGAVPIVLATFPLLAGVPNAMMIFNIVFFAVLVSVLLQGMSIGWLGHWLNVNDDRAVPIIPHTYVPDVSLRSQIVECTIPTDSPLIGQSLIEMALPRGALVVQIQRAMSVLVPNGGTRIEGGDHLMVVVTPEALNELAQRPTAQLTLITPTESPHESTVRPASAV